MSFSATDRHIRSHIRRYTWLGVALVCSLFWLGGGWCILRFSGI